MNKGELQRIAGVSAASIAKLSKGENVQTDILARICYALECDISDIMEFNRESADPVKFAESRTNKTRAHQPNIVRRVKPNES
jgi:DNA-binding Xre family transcriptional regulator